MAGNFEERIQTLSRLVGRGIISLELKVDQVYAAYQHFRADLSHPGGGQAYYMRDAVLSSYDALYQDVAAELFSGNVQALFIRHGERMAGKTADNTPVELGNLRRSGSVTVKVGGGVIYRRPAAVARMSRSTLNRRKRRR